MEPKIQRWTAKRKTEIVLQLLKGEKKLAHICRENDLKQSEVESWIETFLKSGENGLKTNSKDEQAVHERELKDLRAKVDELVITCGIFRKKMGSP